MSPPCTGFYQERIKEFEASFNDVELIDQTLYGLYGDMVDTLDDDSWLRLYAGYRKIRKLELEEMKLAVASGIGMILNEIFKEKDNGTS